MRNTTFRGAGLIGAVLVTGGVLTGAGTAQAAGFGAAGVTVTTEATGTAGASDAPGAARVLTPAIAAGLADLGGADFTKASARVTVPTLAPCAVGGPVSGSSGPVARSGLSFGGGTTTCGTETTDPASHLTTRTSTANGKNFELSALVGAGGPRLRLSGYTATCAATRTQTHASWSLSGLSGTAALPSPVPANYVRPLTSSNGTVLANAVFNVQTLPGDGSVSLTMLRFDLLPASGSTGSVTVGRTACSPTP
ncbi:hypothetical protein [Amycolatopsis sp. PS_44_ISF1]|uniref:hypothetical protein n=1 Tax=Amycolatopsis sp. PS_44_ISF1 TaxID=2974917 RepID=UPI0028E062C6|nr:hypothetical protein [Amycolatopsis sp. PS_44_ISF1]MDT8909857.1 hypothetical protein [Amycolatopsis sp. PS_44_ISF1]